MTYLLRLSSCLFIFVCINANATQFALLIYLFNFQGSSDTELNGSNLTITYTFNSSQPETSYDYANGMNATSYAAVSAVIEVSNSPNSDGIYTATNPSVILRTNFGANSQNWIEYSGLPSFNTPQGDASIMPGLVFNEDYIAGVNGSALQLPQGFTTSYISTLINDKLTVGDAFWGPWESSEYEAAGWESYASITGLTITGDTSLSTDINTNTNGDLNVADAEGISNLLYTITTPAANAVASIDGLSGNWSYQPNTDFIGSDSFMVTIDGNGCGPATH